MTRDHPLATSSPPNGLVTSNSAGNTETGFIEASTIKLNNGPQAFNGTGPGRYTGSVSLTQ